MKTLVGQVFRRMQALSKMPNVIILMSIITIFTVTSNVSHASSIRNITAKEILNLSVNRLVEAAASVARNYAEITYDAASLDNNLGSITISEIFVKLMDKNLPDGCVFRVGALNFSNVRQSMTDIDIVNIGLEDVWISQLCMPFEWRAFTSMLGVRDIEIPFVQIVLKHQFENAQTSIIVRSGAAEVAYAALDVQFDYFSFNTEHYGGLPINARLSNINLQIDNRGFWEDLSMLLPPEFSDPNLAGIAVRELVDEFAYLLPRVIYQDFADQIEVAMSNFVANPFSFSISSNIKKASGLVLSSESFMDPETIITDLNLELSSGNSLKDKKITREMISDILSGNFVNYDDAVLLTLGEAFLTGRLVPKNYDAAVLLLSYLKDNGIPHAEPLLINAYIQQEKYENAYEATQSLASSGNYESRALFSAIEKNIPLEKVLELQHTSLYLLADPYDVFSQDFYEISDGFLTGHRSMKSYQLSYFWALLALASGDERADTIVVQLEMLQNKLYGKAKEDWIASVNEAQSRALAYWQSKTN
ncbi:hypothetical protein N9X46_00875 [Paracoccaceae bacterium]|nr:hypothetical protein [Paracoccaceae bacterium]